MQKKLLAASLLLLLGAGCTNAVTDSTANIADDADGTVVGTDDAAAGTVLADDEATESADDAAAEDMAADGGNTDMVADENAVAFTVTGNNFAFAPSTMTVTKGDTVTMTFKNSDGFHDFVIDELGVNSGRIKGGEETTVTFVADKVGTFEYYCSVGEHRAMGMVGTLTVTE